MTTSTLNKTGKDISWSRTPHQKPKIKFNIHAFAMTLDLLHQAFTYFRKFYIQWSYLHSNDWWRHEKWKIKKRKRAELKAQKELENALEFKRRIPPLPSNSTPDSGLTEFISVFGLKTEHKSKGRSPTLSISGYVYPKWWGRATLDWGWKGGSFLYNVQSKQVGY